MNVLKSIGGISRRGNGGNDLGPCMSGLCSLMGETTYGDVPPDESVTTFKLVEIPLDCAENILHITGSCLEQTT